MNDLIKPKELSDFQWRTRTGEFLDPKQMEARHLFYTLRMIWNHSAPEELKIRPYKRYRFSVFYTPEYMKKAVHALMNELSTRIDELMPILLEQFKIMLFRCEIFDNNIQRKLK